MLQRSERALLQFSKRRPACTQTLLCTAVSGRILPNLRQGHPHSYTAGLAWHRVSRQCWQDDGTCDLETLSTCAGLTVQHSQNPYLTALRARCCC